MENKKQIRYEIASEKESACGVLLNTCTEAYAEMARLCVQVYVRQVYARHSRDALYFVRLSRAYIPSL